MVDKWLEALFQVGSNLAFFLPVPLAWAKGLWFETAIYIAIAFVSGWNHYTGVYNEAYVFKWNEHKFLGHKLMQKFDVIVAFQIISVTFMMLLHPISDPAPSERRLGKTILSVGVKVYVNTLASVFTPILLLGDVSKGVIVAILLLGSWAYTLIAVYKYDVEMNVEKTNHILGYVFLVIGLVCYQIGATFKDWDWLAHPFWHIFMGISLWRFVICKNVDSNPRYAALSRDRVDEVVAAPDETEESA